MLDHQVTQHATVGVVMTSYNSERWIAAALGSLREQTCTDWVCVVVDDGSADATVDIVSGLALADPRITVFRQRNAGVAAARNRGIHELPQDVALVLFLDSDDLLLPNGLTVLISSLAARPDAVGAFGLAEFIDEHGDPIGPGVHPDRQRDRRRSRGWTKLVSVPAGADTTFADIVIYGPIWPSAVGLHRRSVIEEVRGFDDQIPIQSDWDMYLRMSRLGPFAMVERQVAWYRRHSSNLTNDSVDSDFSHARIVSKSWQAAENSAEQRRLISQGMWRLRAAELALAARVLSSSLIAHRWSTAVRAFAGGAWTGLTLLRAKPPKPSRRRIRWTHGLPAGQVWNYLEAGAGQPSAVPDQRAVVDLRPRVVDLNRRAASDDDQQIPR